MKPSGSQPKQPDSDHPTQRFNQIDETIDLGYLSLPAKIQEEIEEATAHPERREPRPHRKPSKAALPSKAMTDFRFMLGGILVALGCGTAPLAGLGLVIGDIPKGVITAVVCLLGTGLGMVIMGRTFLNMVEVLYQAYDD